MKFELKIESSGQMYKDEPIYSLLNALDILTNRIKMGEEMGTVWDLNGNKVGDWYLDLEEY